MNKLLLLFMFIPAFTACSFYVQKEAGKPAGPTLDLSAANLSFALINENIFRPRCVQCHKQYDSYEGVRREGTGILEAVLSNRMPKNGGPLTDDLKAALNAWINAGMPEYPGVSPGPLPPETLTPAWNSLSAQIFFPLCISCHNPTGQARFLDISTYEALQAAKDRTFSDGKKLLNLDAPTESYLLEVLEDKVEPMPPLWSNLRRLTPAEIEVLRQWIELRLPRD